MIWRKLIYSCMCLLLYVKMCRSKDHVANPTLQNFLYNRLKDTNNQLTNLIDQSSYTKDVQTNVEFYAVRTDILPHPHTTVNTFSLLNDTYVFMDNTLFYQIQSNQTIAFKKHEGFPKIEKSISFIKTIEYNSLGLLFIALTTDYSDIYGYFNNEWFFVQSIRSANQVKDAKFFINKNNIYLIIANNKENGLAPLIIYKWTQTHFDETVRTIIEKPTAIVSFSSEQSEIVVTQNDPDYEQYNMFVYEFRDNSIMRKQLLKAHNSQYMFSYLFNNQNYLAIFEETNNSTLYWWDGFEFIPSLNFENYTGIQRSLLATVDEMPMIFLIQKDRLITYGHSSRFLRLLSKTKITEHYEKILDMQLISHNNTNMILIFMLTSEKQLKTVTLSFSMDIDEIETTISEPDELLECFADLEKLIKINSHTLNPLTKSSSKIIQTDEPLEYNGRINVGAAVHADSANINSQFIATKTYHQASELKSKLDDVMNRVNILNTNVDTLFHEGDMMNGKIEIRGKLHAEQLWAQNLRVRYLNGVKWTPSTWLSYTKPQTITGQAFCKKLNAKKLEIFDEDKAFNDYFRDEYNIDSLKLINSLTANNIHVSMLNYIPFEHVYLRSQPSSIYGLKKFNNLSADKIKAGVLNKKPFEEATNEFKDITDGSLLFSPNLNIRNLNFNKINDVQWNIFKDSVFRIGATNRITGSLTGATMKANKLFAKTISTVDTDALLTTTTEQIITSTLQFSNIHTKNVITNNINNIHLETQAATSENNVIKGPVSIQNIQVNNNLHLKAPVLSPKAEEEEHVIGTSESDLLQIYNNKVKIIGNLHLSNIQVSDMAKVIVNNEEFYQNLNASYWLKSENQVIPIHFEAQKGISTPHLTTSLLNSVPISNYLTDTLEDKLPTRLLFENATILGNVIINPNLIHIPDLNRIDSESVKITGSYNINGPITLQGKLNIGNLITNYLDEIPLSDVLSSSYSGKILGKKSFVNLIVAQNIISNTVLTNILNDVNLETLKDASLYLDRIEDLEMLQFLDVTARNIFVSYINNNEFHKHISHMENVYAMTMLDYLKVNGNVQIKNAQQVTYINNHHINDLLDNVLRRDEDVIFPNYVRFLGNVFVDNVEVNYINNINIPNLVNRLLYKNWDQNISAEYSFGQLNTPNIFVPRINDILTEKLINTKNPDPQDLVLLDGLQLVFPEFLKSVNSVNVICNLNDAVATLKNPPSRYWNIVHVTKNITAWDEHSDLNKILKKTVNSKENNIITAPVVFQHHISTETVYLQKLINGVDINEIFADAVLGNVPEQQIITGQKRFGRFAASSVLVEGNANIPLINDVIDVVKLDQSILNKDDIHNTIIRGHKVFFSGLQANRLETDRISKLDPKDLVNLNNLLVMPKTTFHSLKIDNNLDIEFVNGINMRDTLKNRLLRYHNEEQAAYGTYYVDETVYIAGDSNITKINDVPVDDIVLDIGIQNIRSPKVFKDQVIVNGSIEIGILNGRNLSKIYEQAILLGESNTIKGTIQFNNISRISGNITTNSINDVSMKHIKQCMHSKKPVIQVEIITNITDKMIKIIKRNVAMSIDMPDTYLYLEKSSELQISIPNAKSAYTYERNRIRILFVIQEVEGSLCGLSDYCTCPVQETIEITPELSINRVESRSFKRTYTYHHENVTINLFTNTISTGFYCRADTYHDEFTSIALMVNSTNKKAFWIADKYVGYVSEVQFFSHGGDPYVIIGRYYDPFKNTHELNCYVYKIIKDKWTIKLVQKIPCNGAWTLHAFDTAQGVTLVIGSYFQSNEVIEDTGAEIYRFDPETEKFMLLRKVLSTGCNVATDVVIDADSLIILAHKASLQVYKYHPVHDNYYFYQTMLFDTPVVGVSSFYVGDFGISDAYLCVATESGNFYIYSFQYIQGWQLVTTGEIEGLQSLLPFEVNNKRYLFAVSTKGTSVLSVIKQGSN